MNSNDSSIIENTELTNTNEINMNTGESENSSSFSASEKIKNWLQISQNFQLVKKAFKSYKNILLEFVFEKIGYKYKGHIKHPNFLHLSAAAWLLGLFQEIEKELSAEALKENFTFRNLLNLIFEIIVKENVFIENMEILIGKFSYLGAYAKEEKVFRSILIDLNSTKNEVLKDEKTLNLKANELNSESFEKTLEKILLISFNLFLNNINSAEENKRNFILYEISQEAFNSDEAAKKEFKFEEFLSAYAQRKNISKIQNENLRNQLLGFFDFAKVSLDDLTSEISAFNKNSSSLIYKVSELLPKKLTLNDFADLLQNKLNFLRKYGLDFSQVKNLRLENAKRFIESCFADTKKAAIESYHRVNNRIHDAKSWINSVEMVQSAKSASYSLYGKSREYFAASFDLAFNKLNVYYNPLKTATLEVTEKASSYVLTLKESGAQKILGFKKLVFDFVALNFQALKGFIAGENPLFKVNSKEDGFYSIEINKKLLLVNPALFYEFFDFVKGILAKFYELKVVKGVFNAIGKDDCCEKAQ